LRYYDLSILSADGTLLAPGKKGFTKSLNGAPTFTSRIKGGAAGGLVNNRGALDIWFDVPIVPLATPQGLSQIRISGIPLELISQRSNLNAATDEASPSTFSLSAGMIKGLPLANPSQAGVIAEGSIFSAYANWQGVLQSLELIVAPGGDVSPKGGFTFTWSAGEKLSDALNLAFADAVPNLKRNINISSNLTNSASDAKVFYCKSLHNLAGFVQTASKRIGQQFLGPSYNGVSITFSPGKKINAFDGTIPIGPTIALDFTDLIGQSTWLDTALISFKTVLRADIQCGQTVLFPRGAFSSLVLTSQAAARPGAPARDSSVFQGAFTVNSVHQYGNFRQPDGDSWCTVFTAVPGAQLEFD
jgi:hypothetical protein